jgi:hypothetical protein
MADHRPAELDRDVYLWAYSGQCDPFWRRLAADSGWRPPCGSIVANTSWTARCFISDEYRLDERAWLPWSFPNS